MTPTEQTVVEALRKGVAGQKPQKLVANQVCDLVTVLDALDSALKAADELRAENAKLLASQA